MDWNDFAKRLTLELTRLPVRSFLIVQGPGGLPYVQAMRTDGALDAEAVASVFLPRPLSSRQEMRLAALGWEQPDDGDRQNWWHHFTVRERGGRSSAAELLEESAMLAGRMIGAFRDVYLVASPLELVYQASRTGPEGGPLALPGLGIPLALPEEDEPVQTADLESVLASARERGDQDAYLRLIAKAVLYLPSPGDTATADHRYATARFGDGTFVLAFTSTDAMARSLRGQAVDNRSASLEELARNWPDPEWQLAINPGLSSAAYLNASVLQYPLEDPSPNGGAAAPGDHGQAPRPAEQSSNGRGAHSGPPAGQGTHRSEQGSPPPGGPPPGGPLPERGPHLPQHGAAPGGGRGAHASGSGGPGPQGPSHGANSSERNGTVADRGTHSAQHGGSQSGRGTHGSSTNGSPAPGAGIPRRGTSPSPSSPAAPPTKPHPQPSGIDAPLFGQETQPTPPPPPGMQAPGASGRGAGGKGQQAPEQGAAPAPGRGPGAASDLVVMQKVVRPEHVPHYLEGGYDLVAGYVHRLQDVREMNSPARLIRGLGLVYVESPFSTGDETIHVIRWPAVSPPLFRRPLGGIDEWSMGIIPGGWVIEKAPFPGSGYAPGDGPPVPEFKTDSQRLPHGAEMYRLNRSGTETLVASYDADLRRWHRHPAPGGRA